MEKNKGTCSGSKAQELIENLEEVSFFEKNEMDQ